MIEYFFESMVSLAVLYAVYVLSFRGTTNFHLNRIILLFSLFFSLVVPLLSISIVAPSNQLGVGAQYMDLISATNLLKDTVIPGGTSQDNYTKLTLFLPLVYSIFTAVLLVRFVFYLAVIYFKIKSSDRVNYHGYALTVIEEQMIPFTFFHWIFVSRRQYNEASIDLDLLVHETCHKRQCHSLDIVIVELLHVFLWFNPILYFIKQSIKENHEFQADEYVIKSGASYREYCNKLLSYTVGRNIIEFASGFNNLIITKRLVMLSKTLHQKKSSIYQLLVLLPITLLLFMTTTFSNVGPTILSLNQVENDLDQSGTLHASNIVWSSVENVIYLQGKNVQVNHGTNHFNLNGRVNYLGEANYFVFNHREAPKGTVINIEGYLCSVIKYNAEDARKKFGPKGNRGAVEINVIN